MTVPARLSQTKHPKASSALKMVDMRASVSFRVIRSASIIALMAIALGAAGCKKLHHTDTQALYQSGMWSDTIQKMRDLDVSDSEVAELIKVHDAGLSDDAAIKMMHMVRDRKQMFTAGDSVAGLLRAGVAESTVLELARLDQLTPWTGEAQAIRLAGFSDQVVLAIAHRHADRLQTVSGVSLVQLKNIGVTEPQALQLISRGLTDEQAGQMIGAHQQAEKPTGFVRGSGRKHR